MDTDRRPCWDERTSHKGLYEERVSFRHAVIVNRLLQFETTVAAVLSSRAAPYKVHYNSLEASWHDSVWLDWMSTEGKTTYNVSADGTGGGFLTSKTTCLSSNCIQQNS